LGIPVIKAFGLPANFSTAQTTLHMKKIKAKYYLIDREKRGTGDMLSLQNAAGLASEFPLIFAGDLNPINVAIVVDIVKPFAVDVASGIETNGEPDPEKIMLFIRRAKEVKL
jgi:phosphoribosylanthranilate isomerase